MQSGNKYISSSITKSHPRVSGSIPCLHDSHGHGLRPDDKQATMLVERGVNFIQGQAFYRPESAQGRDLAVLAAALHRRRTGGALRVLDVMSASGGRGK